MLACLAAPGKPVNSAGHHHRNHETRVMWRAMDFPRESSSVTSGTQGSVTAWSMPCHALGGAALAGPFGQRAEGVADAVPPPPAPTKLGVWPDRMVAGDRGRMGSGWLGSVGGGRGRAAGEGVDSAQRVGQP